MTAKKNTLTRRFWSERDGLFRYALKITGDVHEAEDVIHDCYLRVILQEQQQIEVLHHRAWLFRIVRNRCIDHTRRQRQMRDVQYNADLALSLHLEGTQSMTPERELVSKDLLYSVRAAMKNLPSNEAQTLSLAVVEGLTYQEIAAITSVPVGTVRSRLHKARKSLRKVIEEGGAGEKAKTKKESGYDKMS